MSILFVTSPENNAGKTALIVALGQRLGRLGKRVGYRRLPGPGASADATFVRSALQQRESLDVICPPPDGIASSLQADFDVLLVEAGDPVAAAATANGFDVVPLIVTRFAVDHVAETSIAHARALSLDRANVLINAVPDKGRRQVQQRIVPALQDAGLNVVGIIPQDRTLLGTTVGELARALEAEVLCAGDQLSLPVEAVMIAAMSDEGAEEYFSRIPRKAVVAAGDRPDIHMPALATDTSCIVLSAGLAPDPTVFKTADQQGVPLLQVSPDTMAVLDRIAEHFGQVRFHQRHKIGPAVALLREHLDEAALFTILGMDGREVA
ncbi:MAG TPA: DRTGG domain-containing protein [Chloroflexota bacterium]|nr:DRTGG domain-containing protein [Chloroflexota bacterium]